MGAGMAEVAEWFETGVPEANLNKFGGTMTQAGLNGIRGRLSVQRKNVPANGDWCLQRLPVLAGRPSAAASPLQSAMMSPATMSLHRAV